MIKKSGTFAEEDLSNYIAGQIFMLNTVLYLVPCEPLFKFCLQLKKERSSFHRTKSCNLSSGREKDDC